MRALLALAGATALLWILCGDAAAQTASPTLCTATPDAKVMQCEAFVNDSLTLPPGTYTVTATSIDTAGNRTDKVVGTVVIKAPDVTQPVVQNEALLVVSEQMWKAVWTCTDDVACGGGSLTVAPSP